MKFLCSGCNRLEEVERFRVEGAVLVVTCGLCGAQNRSVGAPNPVPMSPVAPSPQAPPPANVTPLRTATGDAIVKAAATGSERAFEVPAGHCPKCIGRRAPEAAACKSCGLQFAQADAQSFEPGEWLKGEWLQLLQSWGDDARHEALRSQAVDRDELAQVGRLYRLRLAETPDDPYAVRGRDEVLRLAVLPSLSLQHAKNSPQVATWKYVALSLLIVMSLIGIVLLVRQMLMFS